MIDIDKTIDAVTNKIGDSTLQVNVETFKALAAKDVDFLCDICKIVEIKPIKLDIKSDDDTQFAYIKSGIHSGLFIYVFEEYPDMYMVGVRNNRQFAFPIMKEDVYATGTAAELFAYKKLQAKKKNIMDKW